MKNKESYCAGEPVLIIVYDPDVFVHGWIVQADYINGSKIYMVMVEGAFGEQDKTYTRLPTAIWADEHNFVEELLKI